MYAYILPPQQHTHLAFYKHDAFVVQVVVPPEAYKGTAFLFDQTESVHTVYARVCVCVRARVCTCVCVCVYVFRVCA